MANFDVCLPIILKNEGGFVDDPDDPGGATNKGITFKTFCSCCSTGLLGVQPTVANLKSLTDQQAGAIYRANYWNAVCGDQIASQDLANIVCDFFVNSEANAAKLLQSILNGMGATLKVDGCIGPGTMRALALADQNEVYVQYKSGRIAFYRKLAQDEPPLGKFLNGWINRVNSFPDLSAPAVAHRSAPGG